MKAIICFNI